MTGLANASQTVTINGFADADTITFSVEDAATALAANAMGLNLADNVSVVADGDNELTVGEADALNSIANYDHAGGYTISDDAAAVSGSSVEILGDSDSVTVTGFASARYKAQQSMGSPIRQHPQTSSLRFGMMVTVLPVFLTLSGVNSSISS